MRIGVVRRSFLTGLTALALLAAVGTVSPASAAEQPNLGVALIPEADTASLTDGIDTYRVVVTNHGDGEVKQITVSIPVAAGYSPQGASFNRGGAWIAALGASSLDLRVEQLRGNGDSVTGTVRFVSRGAAPTNALTQRATVNWRSNDGKPGNLSNLPVAGQVVTLSPDAANGAQAYSFRATALASGEPISFWVTSANGTSTPLVVADGAIFVQPPEDDDSDDETTYGTALAANRGGELQALLNTTGLTPGIYTLAGRGGWSGTLISASFTVR